MLSTGITTVVNLEEHGEHAHCGPGNNATGFAYNAQQLLNAKIGQQPAARVYTQALNTWLVYLHIGRAAAAPMPPHVAPFLNRPHRCAYLRVD
jgi:hypothetical protein